MGSKWINKDLFKEFVKEKKQEASTEEAGFTNKWSPEKGTADNPKTYNIRFLPDPKGGFYKKMYYHMFERGEKWQFILCPKTFNFENPCPICSVTSKLYKGTEDDKKEAGRYKRKQKFVSNIFVVDDPRDSEKEKDDKASGKVFIYEFPTKVEQKIKEELRDTKNGIGMGVFDPGPEGFDFILKVGTQAGGNKQSFPEYGMSQFARKPSPIAENESEIEKIMEKRASLDDHLSKGKKTISELLEIMKEEMYLDFIKDDYKDSLEEKEIEKEKPEPEKQRQVPVEKEIEKEIEKEKPVDTDEDDLDDEALLAELQDL